MAGQESKCFLCHNLSPYRPFSVLNHKYLTCLFQSCAAAPTTAEAAGCCGRHSLSLLLHFKGILGQSSHFTNVD
ncbi:hypothetical protein AV530_012627 [Patagioenas fasciata monilis]|uniref:Uncharacterized protein n=1 Tax=Patagioenas fasciata monilis TaxID=372326 RepID=A0A1V4JBC4_PATFA|nr:hypothetical protein AV530_012627 [Patagioenas fasciata monilis]